MDEDSTTVVDNPDENQDPNNTTEDQNPTGDNLDTSKSTDTSDADDTNTDGEDDSPASKFDPDLDEWAAKTNRAKPETDRERELYQELRNSQREFTRDRQAKKASDDVNSAIQDAKPADNKQDEDDDDNTDPLEKKVAELEAANIEERNLRMRSEYFETKGVTEEESKVMGEILKEKVDKGGQKAFEYWTDPDNLIDWHDLARARLATTTDTSAIEAEAARKERARIAKEQHASGPSRSATTQSTAKSGYDRSAYLKSDDD